MITKYSIGKKILIALSLSAISLFANIDQVQVFYDAGQYEEAVTEAKASKDEYSNPELHLLWAKSAEKLGRDNDAMSAYERVEMLDEQNIESRVALVQLYKRTGRDDLARSASKDLQNYQLTPEQRNSLDVLRGTNLGSLKANANVAIGYDTNINVASNDLTGTSGEALSTMFSQLAGSVSYIHEIEDKGGWYGRGDLQVYNQTNFDNDAGVYDLLLVGGSLGAGFVGNGYDVYIPLGYDSINYLDQSLLSQIKLQPRVNYTLSNEMILSGEFSYIKRSYASDFKDRDDTSFGLGGAIYYLLDKDFVYAKVKYDTFSADNSTAGIYVDKSVFTSSLGVNYNLAQWLVMKADYRFRLGSYTDNDRSDFFNQLEVKFSHYFAKMYEAYVSNAYAKNSSDISTFEYDKNVFMFGIAMNY